MLIKLWQGAKIELFQRGEVLKNYIPIQNVAKVFMGTLDNSLFKNEIVNLGQYEDVEMKKFYSIAGDIFESGKVKLVDGGNADNIRLNTKKLYSAIDKSSLLSIEEGLRRFKDFFDTHANIEIKDLIHNSL